MRWFTTRQYDNTGIFPECSATGACRVRHKEAAHHLCDRRREGATPFLSTSTHLCPVPILVAHVAHAVCRMHVNVLLMFCAVCCEQVSTVDLEETITAFEEFVQSVDIASFNKL